MTSVRPDYSLFAKCQVGTPRDAVGQCPRFDPSAYAPFRFAKWQDIARAGSGCGGRCWLRRSRDAVLHRTNNCASSAGWAEPRRRDMARGPRRRGQWPRSRSRCACPAPNQQRNPPGVIRAGQSTIGAGIGGIRKRRPHGYAAAHAAQQKLSHREKFKTPSGKFAASSPAVKARGHKADRPYSGPRFATLAPRSKPTNSRSAHGDRGGPRSVDRKTARPQRCAVFPFHGYPRIARRLIAFGS
jgi:hypothetical protein